VLVFLWDRIPTFQHTTSSQWHNSIEVIISRMKPMQHVEINCASLFILLTTNFLQHICSQIAFTLSRPNTQLYCRWKHSDEVSLPLLVNLINSAVLELALKHQRNKKRKESVLVNVQASEETSARSNIYDRWISQCSIRKVNLCRRDTHTERKRESLFVGDERRNERVSEWVNGKGSGAAGKRRPVKNRPLMQLFHQSGCCESAGWGDANYAVSTKN
jgi:hypothetical protein